MLLNRYLPRIEFDSYEDFKQNYTVNIPEDFNFAYDIVDEWAKTEPEKIALVWCDDHDREKIFTFEDIRKMSNQAANFLQARGVKKGDAVMLILRRRWEYWIFAVALHKIGAVLIPGSLQMTKKDIIYRANAADITGVVCVNDDFVLQQVDDAFSECKFMRERILIEGSRDSWLCYADEIKTYSEEFSRPTGDNATKWDDMMVIFFTSGTTGMPKMASHNFSYPLGHIVTAKYWQQVRENKLHLTVSDSGWAKFSWGKIYAQWICGAAVFAYDMDKFNPKILLEKITKYKVATFCAPPTMYRFMLQEDLSGYDLSCVEHCSIAGEPLNPEVYKKWLELTGLKLYEGFGQTEATIMIATFEWFEPRPGSMGKPAPLYDIRLLDNDDKDCADGEEGRIVISGVNQNPPVGLFTGYYRDEEKTKQSIGGKYYDTGDVAWRDSDGYYWFVGRNDDVIKCSGYRIGPFEVESALIEHPSVVECAVTAAPDPVRGQVVKATVVLAAGYQASDTLTKELQAHVKKVTAPYKYPRIIEYVDTLPKTLGGKIKRAEIRKQDEA